VSGGYTIDGIAVLFISRETILKKSAQQIYFAIEVVVRDESKKGSLPD